MNVNYSHGNVGKMFIIKYKLLISFFPLKINFKGLLISFKLSQKKSEIIHMFFFPFLLENSIIEVVLHISTAININNTKIFYKLSLKGNLRIAFLPGRELFT